MGVEMLSDAAVPDEAAVAARLRAIWSELLDGAEVRDRDHFAELGGDSIAATICVARIRDAFGVDIGVAALLLDDVDFTTLVDEVHKAIAERPLDPPDDR